MLVRAIEATLGEPLDGENPFVLINQAAWYEHFKEGWAVGSEGLRQLAPDGLRIWKA
jgi:hypothetical protein